MSLLQEALQLLWQFFFFLFMWFPGQRCHQLEQMSMQLSAIIESKDELISRLQQPFVGEFLEIDAVHHK